MTRLSRWLWMPLLAACLFAQQPKTTEQEPPEEDRPVEHPTEYTLNPLQADKEVQIGKYYFKKQSFKAAARRFEEATKWNPTLAEAWLRLGETQSKLKDEKAARTAYEKYLELQSEGREADAIRKLLKDKGKPH